MDLDLSIAVSFFWIKTGKSYFVRNKKYMIGWLTQQQYTITGEELQQHQRERNYKSTKDGGEW